MFDEETLPPTMNAGDAKAISLAAERFARRHGLKSHQWNESRRGAS